MLKRYWCHIAFAILVTVITSLAISWGWRSYGEYKSEHAQQRQQISSYQAGTSEQYANGCAEKGISVDFVKCLLSSIDANREAQRSAYDLQAQQEMAEWAFAVTLISLGTFATSLIGVFLVWTTFSETKRANAISNHANSILMNSERPYLFVEKIRHNLDVNDGQPEHFYWEFEVKNYGKSPSVIESIINEVRQGVTWETPSEYPIAKERKETLVLSAGDHVANKTEYLTYVGNKAARNLSLQGAQVNEPGAHVPFVTGYLRYRNDGESFFALIRVRYRSPLGVAYERSACFSETRGFGIQQYGGQQMNYDKEIT